VPHEPFLLEQPQHPAHGGVARRILQILPHLGGGGAAAADDHIHDLALASSELSDVGSVLLH
jgi:hypothetical protein